MITVGDCAAFARSYMSGSRKTAFLAALAAGFTACAAYIILQPVSADPILFKDYTKYGLYQLVNQGRYMANIGTFLRGYLVIPLFSTLFLNVCNALLAAQLVQLYQIENKLYAVLTGAVVGTNPCLVSSAYLPVSCHCTLVRVCIIFSIGFLYRSKASYTVKFIMNTVILWIALGISQSMVSLYTLFSLVMFLWSYIFGHEEKAAAWKNLFCSAVSCICGCGFYMAVWKLLCKINNIDSLYGGGNGYGVLNTLVHFPENFINSYQDFVAYFFEDTIMQNSYWYREYVNMILCAAAAVLFGKILYSKWKEHSLNRADLAVILIMAGFVPPAATSINFLVTGYSYYLLMAYPFAILPPFVFPFLEAYPGRSNKKYVCEWTVAACIVFSAWTFALSDNAGFMYMNQTSVQTKELASRLLDRIEHLDGFDYDMPVCFIGQPSAEAFKKDERLLQASPGGIFYNPGIWPGIEENSDGWGRYIYHFNGVRLHNYSIGSSEDVRQIAESPQFKEMPVFPAEGSVCIMNGVATVKLGEIDG